MTAQAGDTHSPDPSQHLRRQLRRDARRRRQTLAPAQRRHAAERASRHALRLVQRLGAQRVALTLPAGSELDTRPLIHQLRALGVRVHLPCVRSAQHMVMRHWQNGPLRQGRHGIAEPVYGPPAAPRDLDIVFLPLLAADAAGNRLGSGAGYYDRWLTPVRRRGRPLRIGLGFAAQIVPALPSMPWDVPLHGMITERGFKKMQGIAQWPTG